MRVEPQLAFCVREVEPPGVEVRVNFGVFAGRGATPAEIDELAKSLLPKVGEVAIVLVIRRESGVLKRLRATPLPAWAYIAAVLCSYVAAFAVEVACLIALGRILFGVGVPDHLGSLALALLLGVISFCGLGIGLTALIKSAEGASAVVNAIYLPAAFISGSFFSPGSFPAFLRAIADVLPLTYFIRLVRGIMLHGHQIWSQPTDVAVIAAWGLVGVLVAVKAFRWEPSEG